MRLDLIQWIKISQNCFDFMGYVWDATCTGNRFRIKPTEPKCPPISSGLKVESDDGPFTNVHYQSMYVYAIERDHCPFIPYTN